MPLYTISFFDGLGVLTHVERREHPDDISALDLGQHAKSRIAEIWQGKRRVARVERDEMGLRAPPANFDGAQTHPLVFDWLLRTTRPETTLARDYWVSLRGTGQLPKRSDLAPSEMKSFLSHVGLIDVRQRADGRDYIIRLAGSRWEAVFGPMKGKLIQDFLPSHVEARWRLLFDSVGARIEPVRVTTRISFKDMTWLATEMFVAPLREDNTGTGCLFMCFTSWSVNEA